MNYAYKGYIIVLNKYHSSWKSNFCLHYLLIYSLSNNKNSVASNDTIDTKTIKQKLTFNLKLRIKIHFNFKKKKSNNWL